MGVRHLNKVSQVEPAISAWSQFKYDHFDSLNGEHPWMKISPNGFVAYQVRELKSGRVAYFNYVLAKEMGLISADHPNLLNTQLEEKILSTFSLQIINEYDEINNKKISSETIKPNRYMASRYLQLQHSNKQGKTSGDGRGIWNGIVQYRGKIWDVSSRGTGVTCLAPGAVEAKRPLKTGGGEFGYGCGQAEIDELYGAAISAELMHLQGIPTERVLCIIDLGKGYGIGVRAAPNLLRPAHLFMYLKQSRYEDLKKGVEYLIERQEKNNRFKLKNKGEQRYFELAEKICDTFAEFTAKLDTQYIFAWLDWDGDNVLADAGIIDYGSVRQFGIRHDQYRYDDIERFSTNLNEQRLKARLMVQVFVQIADYLSTKKKKPLKQFAKHPIVNKFNQVFQKHRVDRMLYRLGFNRTQRELISQNTSIYEQFDREFTYFERAKISGSQTKVADGVNHPALFNMSSILKFLPKYYLKNGFESFVEDEEFFKTLLSGFAKIRDTKIRPKHRRHIQNFQKLYKALINQACNSQKNTHKLRGILERTEKINSDSKITGNALIQIVNEIIDHTKKGLKHSDVQKIIDQLISNSLGFPEVETSRYFVQKPRLVPKPEVFSKILNHVQNHHEDI